MKHLLKSLTLLVVLLFAASAIAQEKVVVIPLSIPSDHKSFYLTLDTDQEEKTIATHGSLRYFARCSINKDDGKGTFEDRIEIFATSTEGPWYEEDNSVTALAANDEVLVFYESTTIIGAERYDNNIDDGSMVGPNGFYMSIDGESLGLGLNIYGHACTVVGSVLKIQKK